MPKKNAGQALMIIVLIIALVMTVIAATSYELTVETQSSKLQEESVRALAAADSGIETGLKLANNAAARSYTFSEVSLDLPGIDTAKSVVIVTDTNQTQFASPLIAKDDQFIFYTKDYPAFSQPSYSGLLEVYFASDPPGDCTARTTRPALELTFIYGSSNNITRHVVESCNSGQKIEGTNIIMASNTHAPIGGSWFYHYTNFGTSGWPDLKMIIIRPLFANTRLGFISSVPFPVQGKMIESRAYSHSGASKIISVFQSLPQIPADLFVTSF